MGWATTVTDIGRAGLGFVLGVIVYRLHQRARLQRLTRVNPGTIYALWIFICCMPLWGKFPITHAIVASLISAMFIAILVENDRPMGKILAYLGRLSYPLYASHFAVVNLVLLCWPGNEHHNPLWAMPMLLAALILAAGTDWLVSSHWIQRPFGSRMVRQPARQIASSD
jgi:peptidoglycan/LPS O-acetylase OafA/YrhL